MAARDEGKMLSAEIGLTEAEVIQRKAFLQFGAGDVDRLTSVDNLARSYATPVIDAFYDHLMSFEVGQRFFQDPGTLERVKQAQKVYFHGLTSGDYGRDYVENRLHIGAVHERIGLPVDAYLGMYNFYLQTVADRFREANRENPDEALTILMSLMKLVFLDIGLAIDTYIYQRERTILIQAEAIRELPTPVLQVREGLLILPVIGQISPARARMLTEQVLRAIRTNRAKVVIIDITGVPTVDSRVANDIVRTVEASRLMGAEVVLTGISPEIAQTLVVLGVNLGNMQTIGDLQGGFEEAERILGYRITRSDEAA